MGGISVDVTVEYTTVFSMDREWSMDTKINGVRVGRSILDQDVVRGSSSITKLEPHTRERRPDS
ncbi:hypothetical protein KXX44_007370 [Aspergillus fumigatus]|nr:hypothetical protein KXX44_007370 [Aspergillus fumigatus]